MYVIQISELMTMTQLIKKQIYGLMYMYIHYITVSVIASFIHFSLFLFNTLTNTAQNTFEFSGHLSNYPLSGTE